MHNTICIISSCVLFVISPVKGSVQVALCSQIPQVLSCLTNLRVLNLRHNKARKSKAPKTLKAVSGRTLTPKMQVTSARLAWLQNCPHIRHVYLDVTREERAELAEFRRQLRVALGGWNVLELRLSGQYD
jgi:hypothetical protein